MPNAWDIPPSSHVKIGEDNEDVIFLAVGRALTKWEGLEAANGELFAVLTSGSDDWHFQPAMRAFGIVTGITMRESMISSATEALFKHFNSIGVAGDQTDPFVSRIKNAMKHYTGWAGRRNDIAHGCVTASQTHDYRKDGAPLITCYLLCPSHTNTRKWPLTWEPAYQYRASEIDGFADAFESLDRQVSAIADDLRKWCKDKAIESL